MLEQKRGTYIGHTRPQMTTDLHPLFLAQSRLRRRRFDDCIEICTDLLHKNAFDQQAWVLKVCAALHQSGLHDIWLRQAILCSKGSNFARGACQRLVSPGADLSVFAGARHDTQGLDGRYRT